MPVNFVSLSEQRLVGEVDEILISSDRVQMMLGFEGSPNKM